MNPEEALAQNNLRRAARVTLVFGPTDYARGTLSAKAHWWRVLATGGDPDLAGALQGVELEIDKQPTKRPSWNKKPEDLD